MEEMEFEDEKFLNDEFSRVQVAGVVGSGSRAEVPEFPAMSLTVAQAAKFLGVSSATCRHLIDSGRLKGVFRLGRCVRVVRSLLED